MKTVCLYSFGLISHRLRCLWTQENWEPRAGFYHSCAGSSPRLLLTMNSWQLISRRHFISRKSNFERVIAFLKVFSM